jgi:ribosome-binding factor A
VENDFPLVWLEIFKYSQVSVHSRKIKQKNQSELIIFCQSDKIPEICRMNTRRQERFARLIQKELGNYFIRDGRRTVGDLMVSITKVIISPDLGYAKIYVNFLNSKDTNLSVELLKLHVKEIRMALSSRIRHEVRKIPEIAFFYDDTLDYIEKIDALLKKIEPGQSQEGK